MTKEEIQKNSEHWYNKYKDAEKRIEELEEENAELKKELKDANEKVVHLACNQNKDLKYKLVNAKGLLNEMRIALRQTKDGAKYNVSLLEDVDKLLEE